MNKINFIGSEIDSSESFLASLQLSTIFLLQHFISIAYLSSHVIGLKVCIPIVRKYSVIQKVSLVLAVSVSIQCTYMYVCIYTYMYIWPARKCMTNSVIIVMK